MYSGKRQKFDWVFVLCVGDVITVLLSVVVTTLLQWDEEERSFSVVIPFAGLGPLLVYLALVFFAMRSSGLYTWATLMDRFLRPGQLLKTFLIAGGSYCLLLFLLGLGDRAAYWWVIVQIVVSLLFVWLGRLLLRWLMLDVYQVIPQERIAVVGWTPRLERVVQGLQNEIGRFQTVIGFFELGDSSRCDSARAKGFTSLGGLSEVEKVHQEHYITLLIMDETVLTPGQLNELGATCSRLIINFRLIPAAFDILSKRLSIRVVAGVPLLGIQGVPFDLFHNRMMKRAVDIVGAIVGLILSAPIMLVCSYLIQRESPGSPFYCQVRLGRGGKPFEIIKLRSMRLDAEQVAGAQWAVENDPRRLKIGAFLRASNLDEVPQFWNVLKGDMSLVGPRPERPQFVDKFSMDVRHYNLRHYCKPGLSSWAAVHGLRGNTSLTDRLEYDLYYFENWSLWLDFKTMLLTLRPPKNAY